MVDGSQVKADGRKGGRKIMAEELAMSVETHDVAALPADSSFFFVA
jgi:hypothetical protein